VCDLLKVEGVDEHQLLQAAHSADASADATDAAGVVSKQLQWLKHQEVVSKDGWDHSTAYASYIAHQRSGSTAADDE
jgi:hypothetical protein